MASPQTAESSERASPPGAKTLREDESNQNMGKMADRTSECRLKSILQGELCPLGKQDYLLDSEQFVPLTKANMCYIVSMTIVDDQDRILMIQEAKKSCRGEWYLPAGRVEPDETLHEAVQREVEEEAGYQCEPTTLLSIESQGPTWMRFNFTGVVTGGQLKTTAQADKESLQAGWYSKKDLLLGIKLRAKDILPIVDQALNYKRAPLRHAGLMPHIVSHRCIIYKCVLVQCVTATDDIHVVEYSPHGGSTSGLPALTINVRDYYILQRLLEKIFVVKPELEKGLYIKGRSKFRVQMHGILSLEHNGKPKHQHDGLCMTVLVEIGNGKQSELFPLQDNFHWTLLEGDEKKMVEDKMSPLGSVMFMQLGI